MLIKDNCHDSAAPDDRKHAEGLLKLHAPCDAGCLRKTAARAWIDAHKAPTA